MTRRALFAATWALLKLQRNRALIVKAKYASGITKMVCVVSVQMSWKVEASGFENKLIYENFRRTAFYRGTVKVISPQSADWKGSSMNYKKMTKQIVVTNPSKSNPHKKPYQTVLWENWSLSCNCPSWIFSGKGGAERTCLHTKAMSRKATELFQEYAAKAA